MIEADAFVALATDCVPARLHRRLASMYARERMRILATTAPLRLAAELYLD
jgi:hypothetical protein